MMAPNFAAWLANLAPAEARGRVIGGLSTAFFAGQFVSPVLAQPIVAAWSLGGVFTSGGVLAFVTGLIVLAVYKRFEMSSARTTNI